MPEPLAGIRVVEAGVAVVGPAAGALLADLGAEVIKIESPLGDSLRGSPPAMMATNRGKRSVQVDLRTAEGQAAVHKLVATADVFLTNWRDGGLAHMGLDEPTLRGVNPRLIYASSTGFGPKGPDAGAAMLDLAVQARGGLVSMIGPEDGAPYVSGAIIGDTAGTMLLALGVMTALVARERTGIGQRVDTSALAAQLLLQSVELTSTGLTGRVLHRKGRFSAALNGLYGAYATADDRLVVLGMVYQPDWADFCAFAGLADLVDHPLWSNYLIRSGMGGDAFDTTELRERVAGAVVKRTLAEWCDYLRTKPDIVWGAAQTLDEVLDDPQVLANGYVVDVEVGGERRRMPGTFIGFSETPTSVRTTVPELGEGTLEVLRGAGCSDEEVAVLMGQLSSGAERLLAKYAITAEDIATVTNAREAMAGEPDQAGGAGA